MTEPGWYPDPWQPGGWRWHDGSTWTSWTGPPPVPPAAAAAGAAGWRAPDVEGERRALPLAQAAVVALAVVTAVGSVVLADAFRDLFGPIADLFRDGEPTEAELDAAIDDAAERQAEYWWLNLVGLVPLAALAGLAVWANRAATVARDLGYPARHSPGWAAGGWFVPVVNLWFPYQSVVDSTSPANPRRGVVLGWWLAFLLGGVGALPLFAVAVFGEGSYLPWAALPAAAAVVQLVLGLRVVALVQEDHEAALSAARSPR